MELPPGQGSHGSSGFSDGSKSRATTPALASSWLGRPAAKAWFSHNTTELAVGDSGGGGGGCDGGGGAKGGGGRGGGPGGGVGTIDGGGDGGDGGGDGGGGGLRGGGEGGGDGGSGSRGGGGDGGGSDGGGASGGAAKSRATDVVVLCATAARVARPVHTAKHVAATEANAKAHSVSLPLASEEARLRFARPLFFVFFAARVADGTRAASTSTAV